MHKDTQKCSDCREVKPLSEFNRDKGRANGYCGTCRLCSHVRSAAWYLANRDRALTRRAVRYQANRDVERAQQSEWRKANVKRKAFADRAWRDANPEKVDAVNRRRRAMKMDAYRMDVRRADIWFRDQGICQLCGIVIDRSLVSPHLMSLTLDHVIPLIRGGTHEPSNVQLAHRICNCRKGDRL